MAILTMREGISTEEVLFTIASDQIHTHAVEELAQLANTEILQCVSGHELHVRVLPNGDIFCRMMVKNEALTPKRVSLLILARPP